MVETCDLDNLVMPNDSTSFSLYAVDRAGSLLSHQDVQETLDTLVQDL